VRLVGGTRGYDCSHSIRRRGPRSRRGRGTTVVAADHWVLLVGCRGHRQWMDPPPRADGFPPASARGRRGRLHPFTVHAPGSSCGGPDAGLFDAGAAAGSRPGFGCRLPHPCPGRRRVNGNPPGPARIRVGRVNGHQSAGAVESVRRLEWGCVPYRCSPNQQPQTRRPGRSPLRRPPPPFHEVEASDDACCSRHVPRRGA
jgi:hypothetical protein